VQKPAVHWIALLTLTAVLVPALKLLQLPAIFMLGPLLAAVVVASAGASIRVATPLFVAAQALIGCMIARALQWPLLIELSHDWPLFVGAITAVLVVSSALSWLLMRWRVLPGTTAIWGSFPGAALVMTLMAQAYGEDVRLVAFMQYLRMVCVVLAASVVARIWTGSAVSSPVQAVPPIDAGAFALTLSVALAGAWLGSKVRLPAGPLLLPMVVCTVLQDLGWLRIELPPWLLAASYAIVGFSIGARFTQAILRHVLSALPRVFAATAALIVICAGIGYVLSIVAGIDPLTAFLATSPGGADTVAIIAAGSHVNMPFVVAMQTARFLLILFTGPALARFMARRAAQAARRGHSRAA
jgi:membrane AbrB-like protein